MKTSSLPLTISAALLMSCAPPSTPATAKLGEDPVLSGGRYTSGGGLTVAASVREARGQTLVCGVWAQSEQQSVLTKNVERNVLSSGAVFLGGERLVQDLFFMREVDPQPSYAGLPANCELVARAWQPGDEAKQVTVAIARQVVADERDSDGTGPVFYFEPGEPAAGG